MPLCHTTAIAERLLALLSSADTVIVLTVCQTLRAMCISAESANLLNRLKFITIITEQLQRHIEQHNWQKGASILGLLSNFAAHKTTAVTLSKTRGNSTLTENLPSKVDQS